MQRTVDVNGVNDIVEVVNLLHKMMYVSILNYQHLYLNENRYFRDLFLGDRLILMIFQMNTMILYWDRMSSILRKILSLF